MERFANFDYQIFKFCINNKRFAKVLKRDFFFTKLRIVILNVAKNTKNSKKKQASKVLVFKIVLRDWENVKVSHTIRKYMP